MYYKPEDCIKNACIKVSTSLQTNFKKQSISQSVSQTREHAYAHHIQRLMVLGNYALLTGVSPEQLNNWFLSVYVDAYEWVELPNVS